MELKLKPKAIKDLENLPKNMKVSILEKICLASEGNTSNIKKLINHKYQYRLRVGNYRVLFCVIDNTMIVARVKHRKEAY